MYFLVDLGYLCMSLVAICRCLPPVSPSPLLSLGDSEKCSRTCTKETGRTLKAKATEHMHPSCSTSELSKHLHLQERLSHHVSMDTIKILNRDPVDYRKEVQASVHIWIHQPDLNQDGGNTSYTTPGISYWAICLFRLT